MKRVAPRRLFNRLFAERTRTRRRRRLQRREQQRTICEALETRALLAAFTVDDPSDDPSGEGTTLREAIEAANANANPSEIDTIEFDLPDGANTIALTTGEIAITQSVFIDGPGADQLTIDAEGNSRIFAVSEEPEAENQLIVEVSGLTLTNGSAEDGGAIHNLRGTVYVAGSILTGNTATNRGGAIYTEGLGNIRGGGPILATLILEESSVTNNAAANGGGIFNELDHVELLNTLVAGNEALEDGGGVYTRGEGEGEGEAAFTLLVFDSEISDNSAGDDGGGIYNDNDHVELNDGSLLVGNTAVNRGGGAFTTGDGFDGFPETFYATDSTIADNRANQGGGVFSDGDTVRILRSVVSGNQALGSTGGPESGDGLGGGIYHQRGEGLFSGSLNVLQSTFELNVARAGSGSGDWGYGGGIYTNSDTFISDSTFVANSAEAGVTGEAEGGGLWSASAFMRVDNTTFSQNSSSGDGGGIYTGVSVGDIRLTHVTTTLNRADSDNNGDGTGGGLSHDNSGPVRLDSSLFAGNTGSNGVADDVAAAILPESDHNLIGVDTGLIGISDGDANSNLVGTPASPIEPLLGPLQDNFGPTLTHALLPGSPAIDAGDSFEFRDQRGVRRRLGEDQVDIGAYEVAVDFGDAPTTFPVSFGDDGARHTISGLYLGESIDAEFDGQPSAQASQDDQSGFPDDEDGVDFAVAPTVAGFSAAVEAISSGNGFVNAWLDVDGSGDWEPDEQILIDAPVVAGVNILNYNVPTLPGVPAGTDPTVQAFARVRLDSAGGLSTTGAAADGEVEDYSLEIEQVILPEGGGEGGFVFTEVVPPRRRRWYDPEIAYGYDYTTNTGGDNFTEVELLPGFGDDIFTLEFDTPIAPMSVTLGPDNLVYNFETDGSIPGGVSAFRITGIETSELLDPDDPTAFVTGLSFGDADSDGDANVDFTMTALATADVMDDVFSVDEDNPLSVSSEDGVLSNDTDRNGDELTAVLMDDVSNGTLTLEADGSFEYLPDLHFFGTDSFTYIANDGLEESTVATVTIIVASVNDAPIANPDEVGTDEDTPIEIAVLQNDEDVEGDPLSVDPQDDPENGTISLDPESGVVTYTPDLNFNGVDEFSVSRE